MHMKNTVISRWWRPVLLLVIVILATISFIKACSGHRSSLVREYEGPEGKELCVAIELSPLTYCVHGDSISGFDYTMLSDIARKHNLKLSFYPYSDNETALQGLLDGKYQLVVGDLTRNAAMKENFRLSKDIYLDRLVLAQFVDSVGAIPTITRQKELAELDTLLVPSGRHYAQRLRHLAYELGDTINFVSQNGATSEHLAIRVALGEIPYAVVSAETAGRLSKDYPHLDLSTPVSFSLFQTWALAPQDSILADSLDVWIDSYKASPQYKALTKQYFSLPE